MRVLYTVLIKLKLRRVTQHQTPTGHHTRVHIQCGLGQPFQRGNIGVVVDVHGFAGWWGCRVDALQFIETCLPLFDQQLDNSGGHCSAVVRQVRNGNCEYTPQAARS